jgi:aryl-alcohol dehydrogenase-like predicted oxidoreductase
LGAATVRSRTDWVAVNFYSADQDAAIVEATRKVAERIGRSMAQVAYAWVASRPGITAPVVGISKVEQFEDAVAALDLALSPEEVAELEEPYRPKPVAGHV